jgi:hypothetical protein
MQGEEKQAGSEVGHAQLERQALPDTLGATTRKTLAAAISVQIQRKPGAMAAGIRLIQKQGSNNINAIKVQFTSRNQDMAWGDQVLCTEDRRRIGQVEHIVSRSSSLSNRQ